MILSTLLIVGATQATNRATYQMYESSSSGGFQEPQKTEFAPGEVVTTSAPGTGTGGVDSTTLLEHGGYVERYSATPASVSFSQTPQPMMEVGGSPNITITIKDNAKPGTVKIYQYIATGLPKLSYTKNLNQKPYRTLKKKLYRTIKVVKPTR